MIRLLTKLWDERPLILILMIAAVFRLLAALFAKGWGMFDDHFIVIETSGSWTVGTQFNNWLPGSPGNHGPTGHNFFYPGLHYLLFSFLNAVGLTDPQGKMYVVRILHALFSLLTVFFGYKIAEMLNGVKSARTVGILLAILWFMPWMSVRNLVEMVSVPFVMGSFYLLLKEKDSNSDFRAIFWAGILFGLAFNIRPQTALFAVGAGAVYLFSGQWRTLITLTAGSLIPVILIQGGIDFVIWGKPFAELLAYADVCMTERNDYITLPWYNYFLTIWALLIPPVSLFIFYGFVRKWRNYLLIFIPVLIYFVFHSWFPNKQERFILPMIPIFIAVGVAGWDEFVKNSAFWNRHVRLYNGSWTFFWVLNTVGLLLFTFTYSKKARVEAMDYLKNYQNISAIVVLDEEQSPEMMPKFYMNQWPVSYNEFLGSSHPDSILSVAVRYSDQAPPQFLLFTGDKKVGAMVQNARKYFPRIVHETTIEPGFIDKLVHWLNPINKNRRIFIYRNADLIPEKRKDE